MFWFTWVGKTSWLSVKEEERGGRKREEKAETVVSLGSQGRRDLIPFFCFIEQQVVENLGAAGVVFF